LRGGLDRENQVEMVRENRGFGATGHGCVRFAIPRGAATP
jgi:hypothetical protein